MRIACLLAVPVLLATSVPASAQVQVGVERVGVAQGDFIVWLRALMVAPTKTSGPVEPAFRGARVGVTDSYAPEIDFTYMAIGHIGAELILATTKHHVTGRGALDGLSRLTETWVLPPTRTVQYHYAPTAKVRLYVGAGASYTMFHSENASDALESAIGRTRVRLDDSFGHAVQAGVDVDLTSRIFADIDVEYLDIEMTAKLTTGGSVSRVRVSLDPIVVGIRPGMRF